MPALNTFPVGRRTVLAGLGALAATAPVRAQSMLEATELGLSVDSLKDQSEILQRALDTAYQEGRTLVLPAGHFFVHDLEFPNTLRVLGQKGTVLFTIRSGPVGRAFVALDLTLESISFSSGFSDPNGSDGGLLEIDSSADVRIVDCSFIAGRANGIVMDNSKVTITDCIFSELAQSAILSRNSRGTTISANRIDQCVKSGIRIWRDEAGDDGSRVTSNSIAQIGSAGGGTGQSGNGIEVVSAGGVIIADNHITDCARTAVRLDGTSNTQVRGNTCLNAGAVAIVSELGSSGSVIANNVVDGAAGGISMASFDSGDHLANCTGNIVRNISARSEGTPDTGPFGIFAEADAVIAANVVETVPGIGIIAGWGPSLRDVVVADNLVRDVEIGIGVSVADGAGAAVITGNRVANARQAGIAGLASGDLQTDDLVRDAAQFANLTVTGNSVG